MREALAAVQQNPDNEKNNAQKETQHELDPSFQPVVVLERLSTPTEEGELPTLQKVKDFCYNYNSNLSSSNRPKKGLRCPMCYLVKTNMKGILKDLCSRHFHKHILRCHHHEVLGKKCIECGVHFGERYAARIHFGMTHGELSGPFFREMGRRSKGPALKPRSKAHSSSQLSR